MYYVYEGCVRVNFAFFQHYELRGVLESDERLSKKFVNDLYWVRIHTPLTVYIGVSAYLYLSSSGIYPLTHFSSDLKYTRTTYPFSRILNIITPSRFLSLGFSRPLCPMTMRVG